MNHESVESIQTKVLVGHYSAAKDVSGVTSWLQKLVPELRSRYTTAVHLHHFSNKRCRDFRNSSIMQELDPIADLTLSGESLKKLRFTEHRVAETLAAIERFQPDVFLPQCLHEHFFAASIAGKIGVPWVFTLHSDDPVYWGLADAVAPGADHGMIVAVSEYIASMAMRKYPDADVRVIPCGVSVPKPSADLSSDGFTVVYSGRLAETQKRISLVVETLIKACQKDPNISAVIIGDGKPRESLEQQVRNCSLADRIRFTGRVPTHEVHQTLLRAQAILMMSDFEGMPVAIMEGMARGVVPVVRSIDSGIPELVLDGKTGILVDESSDSAADALVNLANSPQHWQSLSQNAKDLIAQQYSDDLCHAKWFGVIDELAKRRPSERFVIPDAYELPEPDSRIPDDKRYSELSGTAGIIARIRYALSRR